MVLLTGEVKGKWAINCVPIRGYYENAHKAQSG
jgi:hypothetical protein